MRKAWTQDEVRALGVRTDIKTANSVLGISRPVGYDLIHRGAYPVKVLRAGHKYIVPVAGLLAALDISSGESEERLTAC